MAALSLREADPGDAAAIARIWTHWIETSTITFTSEPKTPKAIAALIPTRPAFVVAETEGRIAAFATYGAFRAGPGYARSVEHTILLDPDARGRGTGRALLSALEDHARAAGHHTMIGGLSAENDAAIAFHRRQGYAEAGRIREAGRKFERWIDLILMQKMLTPPA